MSANPNAGTQMFYVRKSDGQAYCFSPVPLITENKETLRTIKDGEEVRLGVVRTLTFNGTLLPEKPALSGISADATCLEILDRKSDQLCSALDEDFGNLLIVDATGYAVVSEHPKISSISFDESQMVQKRDYSIVFEIEEGFDECGVKEFDESWSFGFQNDDTVSVNHNISAVGTASYPAATGAVQNAKSFVLQRADVLDKTQSSFLKSPFVGSMVDVDNLSAYNHIRSETINESAGSYQISETWVLSSGSYLDNRTVDTAYAQDEFGNLVQTVSINGVVQGYGDTTFDRFDAAVAGFENVVSSEINFNSTSGIATKNRSDNRIAGTVNYAINFDSSSDNFIEGRTITRSLQRNEDGTVTQTVTTTAAIKQSSPSGIEAAIDFCFANNYPLDSYVEPLFTASLSGNIESVSSERDEIQKSFSLTRVFRDQSTPLYREEFSTNREESVENAQTTISIQGAVYGLGSEAGTKTTDRFATASGAFFNTIEPLLKSRVSDIVPTGTCIGASPITKSIGFNKLNGIVTYDYTYANRFLTSNSSILDEKIEVGYSLASDVVVEIPIPGKSTGPILQDQETVTSLTKNLKITYRMTDGVTNCGNIDVNTQLLLENSALTESDILVTNTRNDNQRGEKPVASKVFKTQDQYTFNRQTLVFTRSVSWVYPQT